MHKIIVCYLQSLWDKNLVSYFQPHHQSGLLLLLENPPLTACHPPEQWWRWLRKSFSAFSILKFMRLSNVTEEPRPPPPSSLSLNLAHNNPIGGNITLLMENQSKYCNLRQNSWVWKVFKHIQHENVCWNRTGCVCVWTKRWVCFDSYLWPLSFHKVTVEHALNWVAKRGWV